LGEGEAGAHSWHKGQLTITDILFSAEGRRPKRGPAGDRGQGVQLSEQSGTVSTIASSHFP